MTFTGGPGADASHRKEGEIRIKVAKFDPCFHRPDVKIVVHGVAVVRIVGLHPFVDRPRDKDRRMVKRAIDIDPKLRQGPWTDAQGLASALPDHIAVEYEIRTMFLVQPAHFFQRPRNIPVIGVDQPDYVPGTHGNTLVKGVRDSRVLLAYVFRDLSGVIAFSDDIHRA